jgi:hypothetical protein
MTRSLSVLAVLATLGCGDEAPAAPPCEQECQDAVAVRSLREVMKLVYNLTLQGKPVGPQEATTPCPQGGTAHVFGEATSEPVQGATEVTLTYELEACAHLERDDEPPENYSMTLTGSVKQQGIIAVQPTATSALVMSSESMTFAGTVYDPPLPYDEQGCAVQLGQSGSNVSGTICGRIAGLDL